MQHDDLTTVNVKRNFIAQKGIIFHRDALQKKYVHASKMSKSDVKGGYTGYNLCEFRNLTL